MAASTIRKCFAPISIARRKIHGRGGVRDIESAMASGDQKFSAGQRHPVKKQDAEASRKQTFRGEKTRGSRADDGDVDAVIAVHMCGYISEPSGCR